MAYAEKKTETVDVMLRNFGSLAKEIAGLEKTKPLPKDKIKTLKTELDRKGKAIGAKLDELITQTSKDFMTHGVLVDNKLAEAAKALQTAKKAASLFDPRKPDPKILTTLSGLNLKDKIKKAHADAKDDADDFGASWLKLRGYSTSKDGGDAIKPYIKTFYEKRTTLMGKGKDVIVKVGKIDNAAEEIGVLVDDLRIAVATANSNVRAATADAEEGIDEVVKEIAAWEVKARSKAEAVVRQTKGFTATYGALPKPDQGQVEQLLSSVREAIAISKAARGKVDLFVKKLAQADKLFRGASTKGDKSLDEQKAALKAWDDPIKELTDCATAGAKVVQAMQKKVAKAA